MKDLHSKKGGFGEIIKKKFYYTIPKVIVGKEILPITKLFPKLQQTITIYKKKYEKGIEI